MFKLERDQKEPGPITGDIFRYTDIDKNSQWFNTTTNDFASEDEVGRVRIPENLKPNSSRFSYIFYPQQHLLFYEGYYDGSSIGPRSAERFFDRLLNDPHIAEEYGRVDVTHIPEVDALSKALKLRHKERIELTVKRPNPDDHADAERQVLERMRAQNVELYEQKYKAVHGQSIEMDNDLSTMAYVSAKNGSFYVKGKDESFRPVEFSTVNHPLKIIEYYDPDVDLTFNVFSRIASSMKDTLVKLFKK